MTFTGLHNIWYALFDFQFEKDVLMANPVLYSIGMQNTIFNLKEFWIWFFYACAQSLMILYVCFWVSQESPVEDGKTFNFWAGGHHVYMNCVLLANIIILKMQHAYTGFNLVIIGAQIVCYFFLLWYFSVELQTDVIYMFMDEFVASKVAWLGCFFIISSFWTIDNMLHAMRLCLRKCYDKEEKDAVETLEEEIIELERRSEYYRSSRASKQDDGLPRVVNM